MRALPVLLLVAQAPLAAQGGSWCDDTGRWRDDREMHCEVREYTLTGLASLAVDGGQNGGITVEAWDRPDILVQARITVHARTEGRVREMASNIEVSANSSSISARGPRHERRESWSVAWRIYAPAETALDLEVLNGGIRITGMSGRTRFNATNGGVRLVDMAGDVSGATTNGGLAIELTGPTWRGSGMDVRATNGGVQLRIPDGYSAMFETGTVNGRLNLDFPITVQGRFGGRSLSFTLGDGGPLIRARTTNGGVRIARG